jgi:hypothetical protein
MTPTALLDHARALCDDTRHDRAFWTTTAAILLTRQAMEAWLDEYWLVTAPEVCRVHSTRARFVLLQARVEPPVPARAYATWSRLSEACHHYSHDLPPSPEDVRTWIEEAAAFGTALRQATAPDRSS